MQDFKVRLENFEGPLDLLLHLVQKKTLGIEEIEISKVIDEYLGIISQAKSDSLNIKVEFLIIASELLEIKALAILSMREKEKKEEELNKRLKEYKFFKEVSERLRQMERVYNQPYQKKDGKEIIKTVSKEFRVETLTLQSIFKAYSKFLARGESESLNLNIEKKYDLNKEIERIKNFAGDGVVEVEEILKTARDRLQLVYIFLGILELYKLGSIEIEENKLKFIQGD